jgi:Fuc2NAc and GlcNAc transferase
MYTPPKHRMTSGTGWLPDSNGNSGSGLLLAAAAAAATLGTLLLTPLVRAGARRWGVLDRPNPRSSHSRVVPRAGGVAVLAGVGLALTLAPASWWLRPAAAALVGGIVVLAVVGFCDDRWGLAPLVRLAIQTLVAAALVFFAGALDRVPLPPPLDVPLGALGPAVSVVWLVAVVNFYNFMDGIDGLAGVQAAITGGGIAMLALDPFSSFLAAALAGAAAGFLVFNWSPASIFLGDVGSGVMGYTLAALPFLAPGGSRAAMVWFVALSLWFFLSDALWTLLRRLVRGERVHEAHREHLYQRLVMSGWSHARVSTILGTWALGLTVLALVALRLDDPGASWVILLLAVVLFGFEVGLVRSREARAERLRNRSEATS